MPKIVLITGASTGFGRASARRFSAAGWDVVATMRNTDDWTNARGDQLLVQPLDVTDMSAIAEAFAASERTFGGVDAVLNVAGIGLFGVFETTTEDQIRTQVATNTFGPFEVMRQAIPRLRAVGGGHIVNLASASVTVPEPLMSVYNASKAALDNLTETVRFELAPQGIFMRIIQPGFVPTTELVRKQWESADLLAIPEEYQAYSQQRMAFFQEPPVYELTTPEDVADTIFDSVTDTSKRLRWAIGDDQTERFHVRHETSESAYDAWG